MSILLMVVEALFGVWFGKKNSKIFRPKQKNKTPPWSTPNDDVEDAQFREEK